MKKLFYLNLFFLSFNLLNPMFRSIGLKRCLPLSKHTSKALYQGSQSFCVDHCAAGEAVIQAVEAKDIKSIDSSTFKEALASCSYGNQIKLSLVILKKISQQNIQDIDLHLLESIFEFVKYNCICNAMLLVRKYSSEITHKMSLQSPKDINQELANLFFEYGLLTEQSKFADMLGSKLDCLDYKDINLTLVRNVYDHSFNFNADNLIHRLGDRISMLSFQEFLKIDMDFLEFYIKYLSTYDSQRTNYVDKIISRFLNSGDLQSIVGNMNYNPILTLLPHCSKELKRNLRQIGFKD